MVVGTGRHARRPRRRPLQLAPDPGRPQSRQARSRPGQDPERPGSRRLRRSPRPGRLVAAARLGPHDRQLSRSWGLGRADQAVALGQPLRAAPRSPDGAVRRQLHRRGRPARRRHPDPLRLASPADPAGTADPRGPAARSGHQALGAVPPLPPVAHGAHRAGAVTRRPGRRLHGRGNHRQRRAPARGGVDGRAGGHGLLPSRHDPLRRREPGPAAPLHADQAAFLTAEGRALFKAMYHPEF